MTIDLCAIVNVVYKIPIMGWHSSIVAELLPLTIELKARPKANISVYYIAAPGGIHSMKSM